MISSAIDNPRLVAISTSDTPDMGALGLNAEHVKESTAEIVMHLFACGVNVAYGGDWRRSGYTEAFFQLALRYRLAHDSGSSRMTNYLAWPVHIALQADNLNDFNDEVKGFADLVLLGRQGDLLSLEDRQSFEAHEPDSNEWSQGLTEMRTHMIRDSDILILIGGRVEGFKGRMPGVAEESLLSLQSGTPLFLVGGFGGCARDIAEELGLAERWAGSRGHWPGREEFAPYGPESLGNQLTPEENRILAKTPYIDQMLTIIIRGLERLTKS